ncbi:MAG: YggS family pyridoxal phosphate-dependent enzyme [Bacteroidetes bacterium]|nr:YggS family pyridoxal phosphate-dependent enzyme [Bacteroidota bacterium]
MIAENLENLRKRIEQTCQRCGRRAEDVRLVAVSKTFSSDAVREAAAAGCMDFGENYVQELQVKRQALTDQSLRWHFIGHLQSNKVKYIAEYIHLIHSVDNLGLGKEINRRAERLKRIQDILVEVHTTDEATKFGVLPDRTIDLLKELSQLKNIRVCGLMTMGPFSDDPNDSRKSFRQLAELKKEILAGGIENIQMQHLSMGMTHDFEAAIEEGSTIVRIGTAIFGGRVKNVN